MDTQHTTTEVYFRPLGDCTLVFDVAAARKLAATCSTERTPIAKVFGWEVRPSGLSQGDPTQPVIVCHVRFKAVDGFLIVDGGQHLEAAKAIGQTWVNTVVLDPIDTLHTVLGAMVELESVLHTGIRA